MVALGVTAPLDGGMVIPAPVDGVDVLKDESRFWADDFRRICGRSANWDILDASSPLVNIHTDGGHAILGRVTELGVTLSRAVIRFQTET